MIDHPVVHYPAPPASVPLPLQTPVPAELLDVINAYLLTLDAEQILQWAIDYLPDLYQTTAFGLTGLATIDMLSHLDVSPPLIFIDTLYHFKETYELVEDVKVRYGVDVDVWKPEGCDNVADFEAQYGQKAWESNETLYDYNVKVEPAQRAYAQLGVKAVITGRRASQGGDRSKIPILEQVSAETPTGTILKLNPLLHWSFKQVQDYIDENNVPRNALLSQGYKSIGDWHSTAPATDSKDERGGRWNGKAKTECGLHVDYFKLKAEAAKAKQLASASSQVAS